MEPDRDRRPFLLFLLIVIIIICAGLFTPLREKIAYRVDDLKSRLFYMFSDPANTLFVPGQSGSATISDSDVEATISQFITETPEPTATPEPLPERYFISGVKYETQHGIWNYCAPTNLSMAMTFWGWPGQRLDVGPKVKPFEKDKNVMFYELEEFVADNSGLRSLVRPGGTAELLKRLIVKRREVGIVLLYHRHVGVVVARRCGPQLQRSSIFLRLVLQPLNLLRHLPRTEDEHASCQGI